MPIELPSLPYAVDALEPHLSRTTLEIHHGRHHRAYVEKVQALVAGTPLATASLEDIIAKTAGKKAKATLFNNASLTVSTGRAAPSPASRCSPPRSDRNGWSCCVNLCRGRSLLLS